MPAAFIGVHELPGDGGQIQSICQILVDIEEHYVVEALLGHSRSQVGFDASDGRKGPFPSCSGNRGCEIDPHQFKLSTSLNMLEASGAAASMFARVRTLATLEALSGQLFRRSGSKRSCLSRFLMSMSLLYKSWTLGGIVPGLSSGLRRTVHSSRNWCYFIVGNKTDIQVDVDGLKWNLQKHRIPGFTPYIKGLELALNF